ncbi:hypothetical protein PIB30_087422 [Stylosanthes scabra]|uniref:Uncharacterized protein n=1 Tax=Stylosanthes scabra TaxID=79078 RepID=A0ABU6VRV4_9FABA|nr:hypothetical protein [Stylosanthes scabra]
MANEERVNGPPPVMMDSFSVSDIENLSRLLNQLSRLQNLQNPQNRHQLHQFHQFQVNSSSHIDLNSPLYLHPSENAGISIVNIHHPEISEARALMNSSDQFEEDNNKAFQFSFTGNGRGKGRFGKGKGGRGPPKVCSYCSKLGHLVDTCYKMHGLPPHLRQEQRSINCVDAAGGRELEEAKSDLHLSTRKGDINSTHIFLSQEQKDTLIVLLQQNNFGQQHHLNQTHTQTLSLNQVSLTIL